MKMSIAFRWTLPLSAAVWLMFRRELDGFDVVSIIASFLPKLTLNFKKKGRVKLT